MSKGQAAEASEPRDSLVGPEEDIEDTGHLQVHAQNGVVIPEDTAEVKGFNLYKCTFYSA